MGSALITGITGQDGSYLAELLLARGCTVHGVVRRASTFNTDRIDHLYRDPHDPAARLFLHYGDLSDGTGLRRILERVCPDEVYNLGAQSHVKVSFEEPEYTGDVDGLGTLRLLEAVRDYQDRTRREVRLYQAGSSEMYGSTAPPQSETTPFHPRSPYAVSKAAAHWYAVNYREAYGLFVSNGILFNHESERRGETFVTRKITRAVGRIAVGLQDKVYLGNLDAKRDWGFAGDYVDAMWRMLQADRPDDYVVATGESHSVREFAEAAFAEAKLDWQTHVEIDPRYFRPTEVDHLQGDARKIRERLGWQPQVTFSELTIDGAHRAGATKLLFLGSSCIYPRLAPQPLREEYLLTGPLEPTNEPYAIAKIAGIELCRSYNRQHGTDFVSLMPTNLYGPGDNFDLQTSHVLPALIRKFHEAKAAREPRVVVWGTGTPRREFLHVDDLAAACVFALERVSARGPGAQGDLFNVGVGEDLPISDLAELVRDVVGYSGDIVYDTSRPDGTPRKLLDVSRLARLGWRARVPLRDGVADTYRWFLDHVAQANQ